ncbi:class I SAM-dependent methyltransferase [Profundibacter amoris]|uniref:DUF2431 domain-containing protein n=1 Tax=Profundibacter amoris TaxID=2171755 RepID=A0A347UGS8_9RHOB|nr:class I SAM-dependent methyltransferase [Profundibacter amoris]AXX98056.1 DUF2431 domain-containing protein [Profundibacter amoris]
MYEYRGKTLSEAVSNAVRGNSLPKFDVLEFPQSLGTKKIEKRSDHYPFKRNLKNGTTLFVGEGNFSFSLNMARARLVKASQFISTSYESENDLDDLAYQNAQSLISLGVTVKTNVDATKLKDTFGNRRFDRIIFQFPNVASRSSIYGQNPNHTLITRFIKNAKDHLKALGEIVISTVDSPYYEGAFKMDDAAKKAGYQPPEIFDFDPDQYSGYIHQNTDNDESALESHDKFATFVFTP